MFFLGFRQNVIIRKNVNILKKQTFGKIGFLYGGNTPATRWQHGGNPKATRRHHPEKDNSDPAEDLHNKNPSLVALGKK